MNKINEQAAWEQLAKMDSKMLDELLAGVCTDVKTHVQMVEKYYSKTDDCEEMQARVYEYMKRALGVDKRWEVEEHIYACYKAGTWEAWVNQIGLQDYLVSIADAPYYCDYFVQERGETFYEMDEDGKMQEYECGPRVELYILAPDEYLDVIDEMGEDGKAYRFCIAVKEDENGKLMERGYEEMMDSKTDVKTHVQMVEEHYSKTDDCDEMRKRVYEYMKMALGVDNKYAVEEHIYACYKAGTWEDRMREIGLKEYLESIADAPYRLDYYVEEESGAVCEKDKDGNVTFEYEFGPRCEMYVLAPSEHLEVMSESDEDGYYAWCIVVDEPDFVETDEVVPAAPAPAAPQRPDDDDLPF